MLPNRRDPVLVLSLERQRSAIGEGSSVRSTATLSTPAPSVPSSSNFVSSEDEAVYEIPLDSEAGNDDDKYYANVFDSSTTAVNQHHRLPAEQKVVAQPTAPWRIVPNTGDGCNQERGMRVCPTNSLVYSHLRRNTVDRRQQYRSAGQQHRVTNFGLQDENLREGSVTIRWFAVLLLAGLALLAVCLVTASMVLYFSSSNQHGSTESTLSESDPSKVSRVTVETPKLSFEGSLIKDVFASTVFTIRNNLVLLDPYNSIHSIRYNALERCI